MNAITPTKYAKAINQEVSLASFIPYSSHLTDDTLMTTDGALLSVFRLQGIAFETKDDDELTLLHQRLNNLYKGLSEMGVSLWTHIVRRKVPHTIDGEFTQSFSAHFDSIYNAQFENDVMVNEFYVTVVQRAKGGVKLERNLDAIKARLVERIDAFNQVTEMVENNLESYGVERLGCSTTQQGVVLSAPLSFLNYLLTHEWVNVRKPDGEIKHAIGHAWLNIGADTIELSSLSATHYAQGLDIKEYCSHSYNGLLNGLLYSDFEFVLTQSFSFFPRKKAASYLKTQRRQGISSGDGAITQIEDLNQASNDLLNGEFAMGEYHFSLLVFGDSVAFAKLHRNEAQKSLSHAELLCVPIRIATDAAFFAQLPANWGYRPRVVGLTSKNFASFSPFHNFLIGKKKGNPWGDAVTRLKTLSGHPFYFNFHYTLHGDDNFNEKVAGNTRMIGMTGTGKTVALGLLYCQAQKYAKDSAFSTVFFDKDRGAEVMVRALGGNYLRVQNGKPTGFNPFQMDATAQNISFLKRWVRQLVGREVTTFEERSISHAVDTVMTMDKPLRRLSVINQNIAVGTTKEEIENSVKLRLAKWCQGGEFAWVFDNDVDLLDFNSATNIGIDGTEFLDNLDIRTPICLYLLHRMDEVIDGRRFFYVMDEAWKWVNDAAFSEFVGNKQLTIRKQNGFGVFATQLPSSLLNSPQGAALIESCSTEIYLPNPKAKYDEYVTGLGLSEKEYRILKELGEKSRLCLIKQGHQSAICSLSMPNMTDELTLLSASSDELPFFDEAIGEVGNNPSDWIPLFLQKVRDEKQRKKGSAHE
uniref:ATPase provides energy for both assembly of typeIV secretion complex and secretion of T-DNA complex(VirB4) n=1 Tax=Aliivibrio fischeri TaxID=668 RepID=A0A0H3ZU45_ALIFS|nr:ATPase provides energy for both assembly of typeIV secretion complex and secretion of T-DNA complex(VirB4) [Aliivibrio fischeri]